MATVEFDGRPRRRRVVEKPPEKPPPKHRRGFSIVAGVIVLGSVLGMQFLPKLTTVSSEASTAEILPRTNMEPTPSASVPTPQPVLQITQEQFTSAVQQEVAKQLAELEKSRTVKVVTAPAPVETPTPTPAIQPLATPPPPPQVAKVERNTEPDLEETKPDPPPRRRPTKRAPTPAATIAAEEKRATPPLSTGGEKPATASGADREGSTALPASLIDQMKRAGLIKQ
jgi:hypothetical protein